MEYFVRVSIEHRAIDEMLCVQNELIKRLKTAKGVNVLHLDNLLGFWRDFLEREHMKIEEEIAFAMFRKIKHPLIDRIEGDHNQIIVALRKLETTMRLLKSGRPNAGREYTKLGEEFAETVANHLSIEDSAFKELAVMNGAEIEIPEYPIPTGLRVERLKRACKFSEELCQEYLGKGTCLPAFVEEEEKIEEELLVENCPASLREIDTAGEETGNNLKSLSETDQLREKYQEDDDVGIKEIKRME